MLNEEQEQKSRNSSASRQLCTSPGCVRCNRNKQELNSAICRFQNAGYCKQPKVYGRVEHSLVLAKSNEAKLFFEMVAPEEHASLMARPIWPEEELPAIYAEKLALLAQNHQILVEECEKALQFGFLWRRNEEPQSGSCWFTFPLINQGAWQEQQCRECPQLTALLHQMDSGPLLSECLFGNVFLSMLPANSAIAEHRGLTNARLRVHFGLEVPMEKADKCFMMVGGEKFHWSAGSVTILDDSFPHSVSSIGCPQDRIVLALDIWHPGLSEKEKQRMSFNNDRLPLMSYPAGTTFQFPSRWQIKQAWLCADMNIHDQWGNAMFRAEAKIFSLGWNLTFFDVRTGAPLGQIKQKLRLGLPEFTIFLGGVDYAMVKKDFSFFKPSFTIHTIHGPMSVSGDWLSHEYIFKRRGENVVATVSKSWATLRDTYSVEVQPGENVIFILACCIVIDKCLTKN